MLTFSVIRKLKYRLRIKVTGRRFTEAEAAYVEDVLKAHPFITKVQFLTRSGSLAINHTGDTQAVRDAVLQLCRLDWSQVPVVT